MDAVDEEVQAPPILGVDLGASLALLAISKCQDEPDSRKAILWEIENWTEELLLAEQPKISQQYVGAYQRMVRSLPIEDRKRFYQQGRSVADIQDLTFAILSELHGVEDEGSGRVTKKRLRDIKGTPEYDAHRTFMRDYYRDKKAKSA